MIMYHANFGTFILVKLRKGKTLRKHSLHGITEASVLLKLFISSNKRCHTTNAPLEDIIGTLFSNLTTHNP